MTMTPTNPMTRPKRPQPTEAAISRGMRERGFYTALGYRSADMVERDGFIASPGSGDHHLQYDRSKMVTQSRQFYRDNGLYRGLIGRAVTNIVGAGFGLQAQTGNRAWNARAEALWAEWAIDPEVRGLWSWPEVQRLTCSDLLLTGDVLAIKVGAGDQRGRLQIIESERVTAHDMALGIRVNAVGRPTGFHVAVYSDGFVDAAKGKWYRAADVCFVALLDRPSATRGVPACQSSFAMLHRINDACDSEVLAMQLLARLAFAIKTEGGQPWAQETSRDDPEQASSEEEGDVSTRLHEFDYALVAHLAPGEEVSPIAREIPGKNFPENIRTFLRLLGLPIGMPLEIVLLDWSQTNYSSARASLEQAFAEFSGHQRLLCRRFHSPVYRWKVDGWIAEGKLSPRPDAHAHDWITPAWPWIDQLKECQAWGARLDRGLATHAETLKSLNRDRETVVTQRRREVEEAIEIAKEIKAQHGVEVPYEIFCGLKRPTAQGRTGESDELPDVRTEPENEPRQPREARN